MGNKPYKHSATPAQPPTLPDDLPDAIISTDSNWKIKSWNKAAETLYGLSKQETAEMSLVETVCLGFVDDSFSGFISRLGQSNQWMGKMLYMHKDGILKCIESTVSAVTDTTGITLGYVMVCHDECRPADNSMELRAVFEPMFQFIGIVNDQEVAEWHIVLHWYEGK